MRQRVLPGHIRGGYRVVCVSHVLYCALCRRPAQAARPQWQIIASRFTGFTQTRPSRGGWACSVSSGILNGMSQNYSDEDFKKLLREISKRFAIAGLVVIALGAAIIGFMYLFYGGIHQ